MPQGNIKSKTIGLEEGVQGVRQMTDRTDMIQPMEIIRRRNRSNEKKQNANKEPVRWLVSRLISPINADLL